jgi:anti-sigma factor RsiW
VRAACRSALEGLAEAATGHVPAERWLILREHLQACADCERRWVELQETVAWLRDLPDPRAPEGFWDELKLKVWTPRASLRPWRAAAAAALAGVLLTLAPYATRPTADDRPAVVSVAVREVMPEVVRLAGRWRSGFEPEVDRWWAGGE